MPSSPSTFLKRNRTWIHVKGDADRYQSATLHPHSQPLDQTPAGELSQDVWPDISPDKKYLEEDLPV